MTLAEAIDKLREYTGGETFPPSILFPYVGSQEDRIAIAIILNAVVKGELK